MIWEDEYVRELNSLSTGGMRNTLKVDEGILATVNGKFLSIRVANIIDGQVIFELNGEAVGVDYLHFTTVGGYLILIKVISVGKKNCQVVVNCSKFVSLQRI